MKYSRFATCQSWISFTYKQTVSHVRTDEITHITMERGKKLVVFTPDGTHQYYGRLGELEEKLAPFGFFRIHTGYVVNWRHVRTVSKDSVSLGDGTRLPIPRDLPLSGKEVELAVILGNALDNAMEGFMRLDPPEREAEQQPIVLEMAYGDGLLVLSVYNASLLVHIDGKGMVLSAKRRGAKPGIGLQSIRYGVDRFGGSVTFRYEKRRFIATAVLPIVTECAASDSRILPQPHA